MNEKKPLKDIELKVIFELMKNSRRSDRELAKAIGSSQPTVSRVIRKLEKQGMIEEYTMIPDFKQLGYQIMGISFIEKEETVKKEEIAELDRAVAEVERKSPYASLMAVKGIGLGKGIAFITLYRSYARYAEAMKMAQSLPHVNRRIESFLVDLNDESNYRLLTMEQVARNIQRFGKVQTNE